MILRRTLLASGLSVAAIGAVGYGLWPRLDTYDDEVHRQRQLLSADPEMTDLVRMATLAANGHNTQPWRFRLNGAGVSILPDLTRRTAVVDPDDHHLYVSLGCAAENLMIAAKAHARSAGMDIRKDGESAIDIALQPGPSRPSTLYQAIPLRQSTRSAYDGQPISVQDMALLESAAQQEGVSVQFFTEAADREAILEFVIAGNSTQIDDPAFVEELRDWIRFSPDQALASNDGLFAACSGNPVLPGWLGPTLFGMAFSKDGENDKYRDHVRSSAAIAVFVGDRADPEHWIKVGRSFERFALQATVLGIRNAHLNQPVELGPLRAEFASWLGQPEVRPDLVIRFGRAPAMPMSLRRPVAEVLI
ncbi:MAG: hypothetical protein SH820_15275 [Xanthomonadales bacterium]|nr:hypothetical protein [Xanthomonadales bacterium]